MVPTGLPRDRPQEVSPRTHYTTMGSQASTVSGTSEQLTEAVIHRTLRRGSSREVLRLLRSSESATLQRVLGGIDPSVMEEMQGREGYQAKRFLVMREDILPSAWVAYFQMHASDLFSAEMGNDAVLQQAIAHFPLRSVERQRVLATS